MQLAAPTKDSSVASLNPQGRFCGRNHLKEDECHLPSDQFQLHLIFKMATTILFNDCQVTSVLISYGYLKEVAQTG